ncbi:MAG: DUF2786 domain-containing protein [Nevskia sp.]|jgi:hypothetical protein|nr:DUF2786 domain-containing protein [Nevskia sp.]MCK9385073.1 DUF2786 domain-containing protein [Nevskia sp.]
MKSERDRLLDKIKKCLRLSKSSNEHEAAAALRQARKLMESMQVTDDEIRAYEAAEASANSRASVRPVSWESSLANTIAETIGCELIFVQNLGHTGKWLFIGLNGKEQIAMYAMTVLLRQIVSARAEYIRSKLKRCKPSTRTRRADQFCSGWVSTVRIKVEALSISEHDRATLKLYAARYVTSAMTPLDRSKGKAFGPGFDDWLNGHANGSELDLRRPMTGADQPKALNLGA